MTNDSPKIDEALEELASMGRRITELTNTFRAHSGSSTEEKQPAEDAPDASECEAGDSADELLGQLTTKATTPARATVLRRHAAAVEPTPRESSSDGFPWRLFPWRLRRRPVGPMLVSTALHAVALLGLALVIFAQERPPEPVSILSTPLGEESLEEFVEVAVPDFETLALSEPEQANLSEPELPDAAVLDPTATAFDQMAPMVDALPTDSGDLFGGGIDVGDLLASVDADAGGEGRGKSEGKGAGRGEGRPAAATFFGREGTGRTALFICDNSASYDEGGFQSVLLELSRAIGLMKPDQSFHVMFFSDAAYPLFHPEEIDTFVPATLENKRRLDAWLGTVELSAGGYQGIKDAADLAVSLKPDVVYFLSDGDHGESTIERMAALPLEGTVVHTFGMQSDIRNRRTGLPDPAKIVQQQQRNHSLTRIAEAHGGSFTPVTISPQAAVAASVRPLTKNRTRGAIWGLKLPATAP